MKKILLLIFVVKFTSSFAQVLTAEEAIKLALQNNFDIQLARNSADVAANNNSVGNAGMLPQVNANGALGGSNTALNQTLADGRNTERNGVITNTANAGVQLSWTLFDGMGMFINRTRLNQLNAAGEQAYRIQVEQTLQEVLTAYYNLVRQQYVVKVNEQNLKLSDERVRLAGNRYEVGTGSKLDYLQSKVDRNNDKTLLIQLQQALETSKIQLNQLLAREVRTTFKVADSLEVDSTLSYDNLFKDVQSKNSVLKLTDLQRSVALQDLRLVRAQQMPSLNFNSGYTYNRSKTTAGFLLLNQNNGLNFGLNASVPLFAGFNMKRQYQNAKLNLRSAELLNQKQQLEVQAQLNTVYVQYSRNKELLALQRENVVTAKLAMEVAMDKFRIGTANLLEVKNAQQNLLNAENRMIEVILQIKQSEVQLLRLSGNLVKRN
ncbi:MAG: TolC family protein [Bacteroidia bacterium]|nr:TolC family protein [Bacteroidia bacterium]MBP9181222.1 TolC family protein [Bacteroidia bacterium]MBP9725503.1 TolC family protein [Bacteroidia bacterium]